MWLSKMHKKSILNVLDICSPFIYGSAACLNIAYVFISPEKEMLLY